MKNIILSFFVLIASFASVYSQEGGIQFLDSSLEEALALAKEKKLPVFIDAYTTWCGPCKIMNKAIFPEKEVGDFYNQNFINLKIDMEKGEGPNVARKYGVSAYPTFLFLNASGQLLFKEVGMKQISEFIATGKKALDPKHQLEAMKNTYFMGKKDDPQFMKDYALFLHKYKDDSAPQITAEAIALLPEGSQDRAELIYALIDDLENPYFQEFFANKEQYKNLGISVDEKVQNLISTTLLKNRNAMSDKELKAIAEKYLPEESARFLMTKLELFRAKESGNDQIITDVISDLISFDQFKAWEEVYQLADYLLDETSSYANDIKNWMEVSIDKNGENAENTALLSKAWFAKGKNKKALEYAEKSMQFIGDGEPLFGLEEIIYKVVE